MNRRNYTVLSMCLALLRSISSGVANSTEECSSYIIHIKKEQSDDEYQMVFSMETPSQCLDYS